MDQAELLRYMVETLESLIAEVTLPHLPALLERFASPQFYLSEEAARQGDHRARAVQRYPLAHGPQG